MRRDYVTLNVRPARESDETPTVVIEYDGPTELLEERLESAEDEPLTAEEIDVAYRFQTPVDDPEPAGVFSLTDRLTGEFVLEVNVNADPILDLVTAARKEDESGSDGCYRIELTEDDRTWTFRKETLLVYDDEGSLLRQHSLIPSGVEL